MDVEKNIKEYFKKFYNMKPYLFIGEDEWKEIINTYEKEDIVEELAKALHTYKAPIPTFTDKQTLDALKK